MGNLVGVVAAVYAGGAGAVFWMWVTAPIGSSTAFVEATLAQLYKEKTRSTVGSEGDRHIISIDILSARAGRRKPCLVGSSFLLFQDLSAGVGISQVIRNSVASSFENAFHIPPIYTTIVLCDRSGDHCSSEKCYRKGIGYYGADYGSVLFCHYYFHYCEKYRKYAGSVWQNFSRGFGLRQVVAGGFGAIVMNGVKRGLFSNEGGPVPHRAAAAAECDMPVKPVLLRRGCLY